MHVDNVNYAKLVTVNISVKLSFFQLVLHKKVIIWCIHISEKRYCIILVTIDKKKNVRFNGYYDSFYI